MRLGRAEDAIGAYLGGEVTKAAESVTVLQADDAKAVGDDHALCLVVRGGDTLDASDALERSHATGGLVRDHSAAASGALSVLLQWPGLAPDYQQTPAYERNARHEMK